VKEKPIPYASHSLSRQVIHTEALDSSLSLFDNVAEMGAEAAIEKMRNQLVTELDKDRERYFDSNANRNPFKNVEFYAIPFAIAAASWILAVIVDKTCSTDICEVMNSARPHLALMFPSASGGWLSEYLFVHLFLFYSLHLEENCRILGLSERNSSSSHQQQNRRWQWWCRCRWPCDVISTKESVVDETVSRLGLIEVEMIAAKKGLTNRINLIQLPLLRFASLPPSLGLSPSPLPWLSADVRLDLHQVSLSTIKMKLSTSLP
jgi:hypothetical protein